MRVLHTVSRLLAKVLSTRIAHALPLAPGHNTSLVLSKHRSISLAYGDGAHETVDQRLF